ncbi:cell division protein FtsW [Bifidobacterium lemurum]|uniref:Probable peptidoglycan glycosyltransferase FtsW n=1 Tax=Bifidobacterium lemurum TaxID=1603886 RepID=A0A261FXL8_9BIFI|nr:putative lipid II flippase FtsW [Bifidobacterium lemurum]OZG63506.1 cell division protein FtsW [Bifidobacterium lemurum]QOL34416.1 putative lipid II flippase FtsW [Bifidobacterium lemurum]
MASGKPSAPRRASSAGTAANTSKRGSSADAAYTGWRALLNPLWCYNGFRVAVAALTCFGLIMVFSSSTVTSTSAGESPFAELVSQGLYCVIGLAFGFVTMMIPLRIWRRFNVLVMLAALVLQALTFTPLGVDAYGNVGWIKLGPVNIQPAEFMKFAICVWLPSALLTCGKRYAKEGLKAYVMPIALYGLGLALVLGGKDLGTAMIIVFIGVAAFLVSGFPLKWMAVFGAAVSALVLALVISSPNRMRRIFAAYGDCSAADAQTVCYQSTHARYAIASGGLLGVGIGNSREKWNYLPAAHNDFIFAIIGEETGFVGCAIVILLFVIIGWCMIVVALQIRNRYVSIVLMCVTMWLVGQALVNIGVVVGVFPVLGVPMPFISSGGSSMVMCLGAAGLVCGLMRSQPQIKSASQRA